MLFDWDRVAGATAYEVQLLREGDDGTWSQAARSRVSQGPLKREGVARGRYRWRVRAVRGMAMGPWTAARDLYVY